MAMTRRTILLLILLLIIFVASGYRDRADATDATISETHECLETGEWSIVWSVYNDDPRVMTVTDQDPNLWPLQVAGKATVVSPVTILPGDSMGTSVELYVQWSASEIQHVVGILDLREEECSPGSTTTTTSSTTTSLPESTTTTAPPGSSTTVTTSTVPDPTTTSSTVPVTSTDPPTTSTPTPTRVDTGLGHSDRSGAAIALIVAGIAAVVLGGLAYRNERR